LLIEGKIEGRRGMGRKKLSWLRNIRQWTGVNDIQALIHTARDRNNPKKKKECRTKQNRRQQYSATDVCFSSYKKH